MTREQAEYASRLDHLFDLASGVEDLELKAHWSRYLCVLVSGFVETAVRTSFTGYAQRRAAPYVANFVDSRLSEFQNPKMEKILSLVRSFSPTWAEELEEATNGEIKDAVDSVVANRHLIAHGRNSGVSFVRIKEWYKQVTKLADLLESRCA